MSSGRIIHQIYQRLFDQLGPQHWWPGETQFEIIVGAILTQNTNWKNVEKAIINLKKAKVLSAQALDRLTEKQIAALIRPSGYFNIKAKRLKNFLSLLFSDFGGSLKKMERMETAQLRKALLSVNGIGPETADSILLYAFHKPVFVIDAYTKRILTRHGLVDEKADYPAMQSSFEKHIRSDARLFNEYHALIVHIGKHFCKPKAQCDSCPLNRKAYYWA